VALDLYGLRPAESRSQSMAAILIVDDDPFNRDLAGMYIEDWGTAHFLPTASKAR
jgi:CheY-like chemotaxis protein